MSYLTCLCEIFPWACHKVTYSEVKVTEICHNDRIALIDAARGLVQENPRDRGYPQGALQHPINYPNWASTDPRYRTSIQS
jgi:hypothetical protein